MQFITHFFREDVGVNLTIESGLKTSKPFFTFRRRCNNQEEAELLTIHLRSTFDSFLEYVASNPLYFLPSEKISKVKMDLVDWNARKHCWK